MKKIIIVIIPIIIGIIIITFSLYFKKEVNEERNLVGFQEVQTVECWSIGTWGKCRTKCVQHWVFDDGSKEFIKKYYKE
jgi:hypothetical protein